METDGGYPFPLPVPSAASRLFLLFPLFIAYRWNAFACSRSKCHPLFFPILGWGLGIVSDYFKGGGDKPGKMMET